MLGVSIEDDPIFLVCPFSVKDVWVEVVVPPLSALLADPAWERHRDLAPILSSEFLNHLD